MGEKWGHLVVCSPKEEVTKPSSFFFSSVGITVLFLFLFNQSFFVPLFSFLDFLLAAGTQINMMHIHKETAHSVRQLQASHFPLEMSHGHETSLGLLM